MARVSVPQLVVFFLVLIVAGNVLAQESESYSADPVQDQGSSQAESENYMLFGSVGNNNVISGESAESGITTGLVTTSPTPTPTEPSSSLTPTPTPTVTSTGEVSSPDTVTNGLTELRELIQAPVSRVIRTIATVGTAAAVLVSLVVPLILNLPGFASLAHLLGSLLSVANSARRRQTWGIVRDVTSGQPIALVAIQVFDAKRNKLLETQVTDAAGRYSFLLPAGEYFFRVHHRDYELSPAPSSGGYTGQVFKLADKQLVGMDLYLAPQTDVFARRGRIWTGILTFFTAVRLPLLVVGSCFTLAFTIVEPKTENYLLLALYVVIWFYEVYNRVRTVRSYGRTIDGTTRAGVGLAIIRLFETAGKRLVSTRVTDQGGNYTILAAPGKYNVQVLHAGYESLSSDENMSRNALLNKEYQLHPLGK